MAVSRRAARRPQARALRARPWPGWSLAHVRRLTDGTGIVEHAVGAVPNAAEGYTLDDNARALVVAVRYHRFTRDPEALELAFRYLSFIVYCQTRDGWFHNDVGWDRRFRDRRGSEDAVGRAIWALGETVAAGELEGLRVGAWRTLERSLPRVADLQGLRPIAFALLGLRAMAAADRRRAGWAPAPDAVDVRSLGARLGARLAEAYRSASGPGWRWFEERLTYCNARLSHGMLAAWELTGHTPFLRVARESYEFLWRHLWDGACLHVVGNRGWWPRGLVRASYDQQPVDAGAMAELAAAMYLATRRPEHLHRAQQALEWFYGRNARGVAVFDEATGGCRDGLGPQDVNPNQGAESTLAHLLARMAVEQARRRAEVARGRAMMV